MTNDKIPIGKYKCMRNSSGEYHYYIEVGFKKGIPLMNNGDIVTLDMIEPYESEAVRKVTNYLLENFSVSIENAPINAKAIIDLVHEAEDSDE